MNLQEKNNKLNSILDEICKEDVCVAFSGGVDSSLLLGLIMEKAKKYDRKVYGVTFSTHLHPQADMDIARRVAEEVGAIHHVLEVNEWEEEGLRYNPKDRCYLCKRLLFGKLIDFAKSEGVTRVIEGTNAQELEGYRPGFQAVQELGVVSPLAEAEFSKEEVRALAKEHGISVSGRPSAPCLATRFPYGTYLDESLFPQIEAGEAYLREKGFYNVRLRVHDDILRLEVDSRDFPKLLGSAEEIVIHMKSLGFSYITLDLEGFRSGSMDLPSISIKRKDNIR